jgi:hypothetical protein
MKPLLVFYTQVIDNNSKDENGKTELDYWDEVLQSFTDEYRIIHLYHGYDIPPRVELLSIQNDITPLQLKELEQELIKRFQNHGKETHN